MSLFSKLFQKDPLSLSLPELEEQLPQAEGDLARLAKLYYAMGVRHAESGDPDRAMVCLSRADAIFSSRDDVFRQVGKKIREDCSERLGALEDEPLLVNRIAEETEEQAQAMTPAQVRQWGLLSLARLAKVGERLSVLPGCGVLGELGRTAELVLASLYQPIGEGEYQYLKDVCNRFYELGDSEEFSDLTQQAPVPGGAPIQAFDLNGLLIPTELNLYLDVHLRFLALVPEGDEPESGIIPCAVLPDYWLRTRKTPLEEVPQVQAELRRIQSDHSFLLAGPLRDALEQRVRGYLALDVLAEP